jgi:hypothetical protein
MVATPWTQSGLPRQIREWSSLYRGIFQKKKGLGSSKHKSDWALTDPVDNNSNIAEVWGRRWWGCKYNIHHLPKYNLCAYMKLTQPVDLNVRERERLKVGKRQVSLFHDGELSFHPLIDLSANNLAPYAGAINVHLTSGVHKTL